MAQLTIKTNAPQISASMARLGPALFAEMSKQFDVTIRKFLDEFDKSRLHGRPGLYVRTGFLRESFDKVTLGNDINSLRSIAFTNAKYARIQEEGGTVVPVTRKYLAIPLDAVKTPAGVPRGGPLDYPNTSVIRSKRGNLLIVDKITRTPLFALKKSVTIPARMGFVNAWVTRRPTTLSEIAAAVNRGIKRTFPSGPSKGPSRPPV